MREKSSMVFTSFSSRSALRCEVDKIRRRAHGKNAMRIRQRVFERPQHQRQRRAKLVADIGEELRLQHIELCQFLALPRNLALLRLFLGDVATLGRDEHDIALFILYRAQRGIDDDGLLAPGASEDFRIPANELALRSPHDGLL